MKVDRVQARRASLPWGKAALIVVVWYVGLLVVNASLNDVSFAGAAVFYVFWTLPGLVIPILVAWRAGVGPDLVAPLAASATAATAVFFLSGQAACRPSASSDLLLVLSWGTMAMTALSAGLVRFRLGRRRWMTFWVAVAGAALLGFLSFLEGENCDFGVTVEGGVGAFFWPMLLMFTYPAALAGALGGAGIERVRRRVPRRPDL